jgi:hypothetical protein
VHAVAEPHRHGTSKAFNYYYFFLTQVPRGTQKKKKSSKLPLDTSYMNCLVPLLSAWRRTSCLIGLQACV